MNRILIPLTILLGSLLYSWFWNCNRKPYCASDEPIAIVEEPAAVAEEEPLEMTLVEKALFEPLDVYFQTGSSNIIRTQEVDDWLELARNYLAENPEAKLSVTGHTDNTGTDAINDPLSETRASTVSNILSNEGFSSSNLVVSGKGSREPKADNSTEEGRNQNRRVSIRLIN